MDPSIGEDAACSGWDNRECRGSLHCPPRCPRFFDRENTPILIAPFEDGEFSALVSMYESLGPKSRTSGLPPRGRNAIEAWLESLIENGWHLLARDNGQLAGHVGVSPADDPDPEFLVYVHDDYQGRGIGTELVKQVTAYANSRGHDQLTLSVEQNNERAISVYENVSFEVSECALLTLAMRLSLDQRIAEEVHRPPADR